VDPLASAVHAVAAMAMNVVNFVMPFSFCAAAPSWRAASGTG